MCLCAYSTGHAQAEKNVIKAAYLRNVMNFANWPAGTFKSSNADFQIGFAGTDPEMEGSLEMAFEKLNYRIQNRRVNIRIFRTPGALEVFLGNKGANGCQAIFLPTSETVRAKQWIDVVGNKPVLLFSEDPGFIDAGGSICLTPNPRVKGRFYYTIHTQRLQKQKIRFTTQFLRMRSAVKTISK